MAEELSNDDFRRLLATRKAGDVVATRQEEEEKKKRLAEARPSKSAAKAENYHQPRSRYI